jgi:Asp/Glu/hydantoin racemase
MLDCGRKLRDDYRADVVILGCAGMARFRSPLEADLGRPVIDPTQAAVTLAIGAVRLLPSS